jgi:TonB family protein
MDHYILYFTKTIISLSILYAVYRLFLRKETFFKFNRIYLIGSVIISMLIPGFTVLNFTATNSEPLYYVLNTVTITNKGLMTGYSGSSSLTQIVWIVYFAGVILFSLLFLFRIFQLIVFVNKYGITKEGGVKYVITDGHYAPFSFFNLIFINSTISKTDKEKVVVHERVHVNQLHSLDVLFFELLAIFQWFNPIVWLYKKSIKEVHEFLADEGVLTKGVEKSSYQELLLALALGVNVTDLTNNFNTTQIKRRFIMMTKMKSGLIAKVRILMVVPFAAVALLLFACNNNENKKEETTQNKVDSVKEQTTVVQENVVEGKVYDEVEQMPVYGKSQSDLSNYLASNIKYPQEAKEKNIQGKVLVSFVVAKTGAVTNVKVDKSVNKLLDAEAVRVVSAMPNWTPGKNKGEAVNVNFVLPISFKLQ